MRDIVYYVATSMDGFIGGSNDAFGFFAHNGNGVEKYLQDLKSFDTVIMGRKTYEFGYRFGLEPGKPAYPHMKHYIFSDTLTFEEQDSSIVVEPLNLGTILALKRRQGSPIYLCGGGQFAGWLLENEQIDVLKIKLNPFIMGSGIRIFGDVKKRCRTRLMDSTCYDQGLQIMTFSIQY